MSADCRGKGASPTNHCWCQNTRVIAVSCGIKISTVHHLVLSQYTRLTDRQTDGQMYRTASAILRLHYMQSHGKNGIIFAFKQSMAIENHIKMLENNLYYSKH